MSDLELKIKRITIMAEARGMKVNSHRIRRGLRRLAARTAPTTKEGDLKRGAIHARLWESWVRLHYHRIDEVRPEARAMHLACNFLRGRDYVTIEPISRWPGSEENFEKAWGALWERVKYHIERHIPEKKGTEEYSRRLQEFAAWHDHAHSYARNADAQKAALGIARAASLAAASERRQAYEKRVQNRERLRFIEDTIDG